MIWTAMTLVTRYVSVGSIAAAIAFPITFAVIAYVQQASWGSFGRLWPLQLFSVVLAALVVYRHRSNIRRLAAGVELKVGASGEV